MTSQSEDWEPSERPAWEAEDAHGRNAGALAKAPFGNPTCHPGSRQAFALMSELAKRYPRPQAAKGKSYARKKTLVDHAHAMGAFIADLLAAVEADRSEGWLRCSLKKGDYTGQYV